MFPGVVSFAHSLEREHEMLAETHARHLLTHGRGLAERALRGTGGRIPLTDHQPSRGETLFSVKARDVHDALWALSDEQWSLVLIEAEWNRDGCRKLKMFTLVYRLGYAGDRIERHVSMT